MGAAAAHQKNNRWRLALLTTLNDSIYGIFPRRPDDDRIVVNSLVRLNGNGQQRDVR